MFAAMYKLPITIMVSLNNKRTSKQYTANQIPDDKLNKLIKLEKIFYTQKMSKYPTIYERNFASVKVAKQLLESDVDIDTATKEYLQWIVNNFSKLINTDIEAIYNQTTFDPNIAEDLDKYLDTLINQNDVKITECFKYLFNDNNLIPKGEIVNE